MIPTLSKLSENVILVKGITPIPFRKRPGYNKKKKNLKEGDIVYVSFGLGEAIKCIFDGYHNEGEGALLMGSVKKPDNGRSRLYIDEICLSPEDAVRNEVTF